MHHSLVENDLFLFLVVPVGGLTRIILTSWKDCLKVRQNVLCAVKRLPRDAQDVVLNGIVEGEYSIYYTWTGYPTAVMLCTIVLYNHSQYSPF